MKKIPQDVVGDIAILKFRKFTPWFVKKFKALLFLRDNPSIRTVLEKKSGFSGDLRIQKTSWIAGFRTSLAHYRENDCVFTFDVDETYFSPRLSHERKLMAELISRHVQKLKNPKILVLFAGVGPFPIVIARVLKKNKVKARIVANELNKHACVFAEKNIVDNKVTDYVRVIPGDARRLSSRLKEKFDVILMPRPNLEETFLKSTLKLAKKGSLVLYHGFGLEEKVKEEILRDARSKIMTLHLRKAGDIGPRVFRWLASFTVK